MRPDWLLLLVFCVGVSSWPSAAVAQTPITGPATQAERLYRLPRRVMPLEKALIKLRDQGAELGYRPDQLPQLAIKVPGGRRSLGAWLGLLLRGTEITYEPTTVGYLLYPDPALPAKRLNLYGTITDATTGERLLGAAVQIPDEGKGVVANEYGFYSLPINGGRRNVRVTYIGYQPLETALVLRQDSILNFTLQPDRDLPAVIVQATPSTASKRMFRTDTRTSIGSEEVGRAGGPGGEADPLRLARLLPGVESGADGLGGLFVRGSEAGHNLVLLDGVPVYNVSHAAGLFSVFNNDAIRRLDLYKEGVPARFGGRIGGVLDVHTRDGNVYDTEVAVGTSLLAANVTAEGPIKTGESSFLVSSRYFWTGGLLKRASERYKQDLGREGALDYQVYDVNLKVNHAIGKKGRLYLSAYRGVDGYRNTARKSDTITVLNPTGALFRYAAPRSRYEDATWSNNVVALRYNHVFNRRLFGNFRAHYSDLLVDAAYERSDSLNELSSNVMSGDIFSGRYGTDIRQIGVAFDGHYTLAEGGEFRFGVEGNRHRFTPQLNSGSVPLSFHPQLAEVSAGATERPLELSAYASLAGRLGGLNYRVGLRSQYWVNGSAYLTFSPRMLLAGPLSPSASWRVAYDRSVQSVHLVSSTVIGLPTDTWVPATNNLAPATSSQLSATYLQRLGDRWNVEASLYYRDLGGLVSFSEGAGQAKWVDNLSRGAGFARGAEVTLSRSSTKFRGWFSYVLSQSRREFEDDINLGRAYDFRYGRRHAIKLFALYMPSPRVSLSASWRYGSGAFYSLSKETFLLVNPAQVSPEDQIETVNLIEDKNGVQLPANHRLDVNAQFQLGPARRDGSYPHTLGLGVYNVYSRHNPIYYDIQTEYFARREELVANRDFVQVYLAPITPTISYKWRFGLGGNN